MNVCKVISWFLARKLTCIDCVIFEGCNIKITVRISVKAVQNEERVYLHALCLIERVCRELINRARPTAG